MNVKLINTLKLFRETFPPYGLALINAFLNKNSISSKIFDLDVVVKHDNSSGVNSKTVDIGYIRKNYENMYKILKLKESDEYLDLQFDKMISKMNFDDTDVVGLNSHDNEIYTSLYLAKKIKEKTGCTTVIGGSHARRLNPGRIRFFLGELRPDYVDYFVKGGHYEFFLNLDKNKAERDSDKHPDIVIPGDTSSSLNDYELPLYNEEHLELYKMDIKKIRFFYPRINNELFERFNTLGDIETAKPVLILPYKFLEGCYNKCAFCYIKRDVFKLDEDKVISLLKEMSKKYNCKNFYFLNNNIIMDKKYSVKIFKRMADEMDIRWSDSASIRGLDSKMAKLMAESGCTQLLFGVESASKRMLQYTNKNSGYNKLEYYTKCFKLCDKNGIWVVINLVGGMPYENGEDVKGTIKYVEENKNRVNGIFVNRFIMTEITDFFNNYQNYGIQITDDQTVQESIKSKFGEHSDVYLKIYYRHFPFSEINGLDWEAKERQIRSSTSILRRFISERFKKQFYIHYPLFFLYEAFNDNKKDIVAFLNGSQGDVKTRKDTTTDSPGYEHEENC